MSFGWTLLGTALQLMLAYFLFMLVAFSAGSITHSTQLGKVPSAILNLSIYALPACCMLSAGIVAYLHLHGGSTTSYWWYAMPVAGAMLYLLYAFALNRA